MCPLRGRVDICRKCTRNTHTGQGRNERNENAEKREENDTNTNQNRPEKCSNHFSRTHRCRCRDCILMQLLMLGHCFAIRARNRSQMSHRCLATLLHAAKVRRKQSTDKYCRPRNNTKKNNTNRQLTKENDENICQASLPTNPTSQSASQPGK